MKNCLVLGGAGFIGSHVSERLIAKGYSVRVFDKFNRESAGISHTNGLVETVAGDFLNEVDMRSALVGIDCVFHFVSTTVPASAAKDPIYDVQTNIAGSVKLLQMAVASNVEKVVFSSSGGTIYGEPKTLPVPEDHPLNPMEPYAISKLAIEKYLDYFRRSYGLDYLIMRYSNPYGERQNPLGQQGVIPIFLNKIKMGERPTIYGDGSTERDYVYIGDAVDATVSVFEKQTKDRVFNVGSGKATSLNDLVKVISAVVGKDIQPIYVPDQSVRVQRIVLDVARLKEEAGWSPETALKDGIEKTWRWITRTPLR